MLLFIARSTPSSWTKGLIWMMPAYLGLHDLNDDVVHRRLGHLKEQEGWYRGIEQAASAVVGEQGSVVSEGGRPVWILPAVLVLAATAVTGVVRYPALPQGLVTHYRINGPPNGFARKGLTGAFRLALCSLR